MYTHIFQVYFTNMGEYYCLIFIEGTLKDIDRLTSWIMINWWQNYSNTNTTKPCPYFMGRTNHTIPLGSVRQWGRLAIRYFTLLWWYKSGLQWLQVTFNHTGPGGLDTGLTSPSQHYFFRQGHRILFTWKSEFHPYPSELLHWHWMVRVNSSLQADITTTK